MWLLAGVFPSALVVTTFMAPLPEQMSCIDWGLTSGDAIATPMDNVNQTSMKRAIRLALRRCCIGRLLQERLHAGLAEKYPFRQRVPNDPFMGISEFW